MNCSIFGRGVLLGAAMFLTACGSAVPPSVSPLSDAEASTISAPNPQLTTNTASHEQAAALLTVHAPHGWALSGPVTREPGRLVAQGNTVMAILPTIHLVPASRAAVSPNG